MKKKIILVNYVFTTGSERYEQSVLVSLKYEYEGQYTVEQEENAAIEAVIQWFKTRYPESELISVVPNHTISATMQTAQDKITGKIDVPLGWFTSDVKPLINPETKDCMDGMLSDYVLIDLDGERKDYAIGCYHYPYTLDGVYTGGWWSVDEFKQSLLDVDNMRWSYLPLKRYEK